jgi:hypothetical protein
VWVPYSFTFTYTGVTSLGTNNCNYISFVSSGQGSVSVELDDVSIVAIGSTTSAASFTLPANLCPGQTIPNLSVCISPYNSMTQGGQFLGPGVQNIGGVWSLNTSGLNPGIQNYSFVYTNTVTHCTYTTYAQMNIPAPLSLSISAIGANSLCLLPGQTSTTLQAQGAPGPVSFTWQPGSATTSTFAVSPTVTTVYTLTGNNSSCTAVQTVTVNVIPPITFANPPTAMCTGFQMTNLMNILGPGSPTGGVWSSTSPTGAQYNIGLIFAGNAQVYAQPGTAPGTYTISYSYTAATGCSLSAQFPLNVLMTPTLTTNGPLSQCTNIPGYTSTLMVVSSSTLPMTYTWMPGSIVGATAVVSPSSSLIYSVTGTDGTCTSQPALEEVDTNSLCCGSNTSSTAFNYINSSTIGSATLSGLYAIILKV